MSREAGTHSSAQAPDLRRLHFAATPNDTLGRVSDVRCGLEPDGTGTLFEASLLNPARSHLAAVAQAPTSTRRPRSGWAAP